MSVNMRASLRRLAVQEDLNFLLTNRLPRQAATRLMGWFSRIEHPWVRDASIAVWRLFTDLDLSDARKPVFRSLHDCFTRELRPGARPFDPDPAVLASPCDAIVGACGRLDDTTLLQAKGLTYTLEDLVGSAAEAAPMRGGSYVTLRLTSAMYHRFHAPDDARVEHVRYISGDTWNVNPVAVARIERLFCRNERAVLRLRLARDGIRILVVPVAAILVASMRLRFVDVRLHLRYRGPNEIPCAAPVRRGDELGGFEHGSTIIVVTPHDYVPCEGVVPGTVLRAGQPLLVRREP
jgi:phosphatidylserine decarboxylase